MKRTTFVAVAALFAILYAAAEFSAARSQDASGDAASGQQPPVTPNSAGSVASQGAPPENDTQASLQCQGCHTPGSALPYLAGALFHKGAHTAYDHSAHASAVRNGKKGASCLDCHSGNGQWDSVFPTRDARSTVNRVNVSKTCAKCHEQQAGTFHDSIHGKGQSRGIGSAASCSDCHGVHDVLPAADPSSMLHRTNVPGTCATCHQAILSDFETSSHGAALRRGDERAPVCTTCHMGVSHAPAPATLRDFQMSTVAQCVTCHEKQAPSYRDTFHGQATALGFRLAATCADCHTPHQNLPASDSLSSVHEANLINTCARCHSGATASFVTFDPHAEPTNMDRSLAIYSAYTFMTLLFFGVFGFFGLHTLLWLQRSVVGMFRGEARAARDGERWVVRFSRPHRATHLVMVVSFLALAATGLPLMFYYTPWGEALAGALGGPSVTMIVHRVFAVVTFGYAFYHLGYLLWLRFRKNEHGLLFGPDSMVPRTKDVRDLYHMVRWFLYLDRKPPRFDRWTYWEKFDYFAVFWGVPIIGLSGLVLWLPALFSNLLPGVALNVAMIVHGEEALLATGFIFAFHFFHNHMRPENFPLDTVIFTGKMPLERFQEERPEEYRRLCDEGRLDEVLADPPTPRERTLATLVGATAYIVGLALMAAIFWSLVFSR